MVDGSKPRLTDASSGPFLPQLSPTRQGVEGGRSNNQSPFLGERDASQLAQGQQVFLWRLASAPESVWQSSRMGLWGAECSLKMWGRLGAVGGGGSMEIGI